jgi:hypothetical protein
MLAFQTGGHRAIMDHEALQPIRVGKDICPAMVCLYFVAMTGRATKMSLNS